MTERQVAQRTSSGSSSRPDEGTLKKAFRTTAHFFGLDEETCDEQQRRWDQRRCKLATRSLASTRRTDPEQLAKQMSTTSSAPGTSQFVQKNVYTTMRRAMTSREGDRKTPVGRSLSALSTVPVTFINKEPRESDVVDYSRAATTPEDVRLEPGIRLQEPVLRSAEVGPRTSAGGSRFLYNQDIPLTLLHHNYTRDLFYDVDPRTLPVMEKVSAFAADQPESFEDLDVISKAAVPVSSDMVDLPLNRMVSSLMEEEKRQVGVGFVGKLCCRGRRKQKFNAEVRKQIDEISDKRPYFTYWVTLVQVVVFIASVSLYGFAPFGFSSREVEEVVLLETGTFSLVTRTEVENFWLGPSQQSLIHLGARYSPCMRRDSNVLAALEQDRKFEQTTGCCIRSDGSGCYQAYKEKCAGYMASFVKWTPDKPGTGGFKTGPVCGLSPDFCQKPSTSSWDPNDLTLWPLCQTSIPETAIDVMLPMQKAHMTCDISGKPCCVGIQGQCMITTREHCDFRNGYFHQEAFTCAQVSCLGDVCGMIPFYNEDSPDQFYRLWTSLFLHAGVVHLVITVVFQLTVMRDLEKFAGWLRIAIIYLVSGLVSNLASGIFLPYNVEAGPSGSQFALLACLFVEIIQSWQLLNSPWISLGKLVGITLLLFIFGFFPMVDNYAHLTGFITGLLLSFALLPYIRFGEGDRIRKLVAVIVCLLLCVVVTVVLFLFFYVTPIYECKWCSYFTCIPFTPEFCANQKIEIRGSSSSHGYFYPILEATTPAT